MVSTRRRSAPSAIKNSLGSRESLRHTRRCKGNLESSGRPTANLSSRRPAFFPSFAPRFSLQFALILALLPAFLLPAMAELVPRDSTTSTSRQFVVQSENREVRSRAASFAEEIRTVWVETLGLTGNWQFPVRILFPGQERRRPRQSVNLTMLAGDRDSLWVQVTVTDPGLIGSPELAAWIFQALALEYTARFFPPAPNRVSRLAPQWFVQGLVQQWQGRRNPPPVQIVEGLLAGPKPPTVAGILRQRNPIPSATEELTFRLLSLALVRTLVESPQGRAGLRELVGRLGEAEMDQAAILRAFPSFEEKPERLERQWALTLARLAYTTRVRLLGFAAMQRELSSVFALTGELPRRGGEVEEVSGPLAMLALARDSTGQRALTGLVGVLLQLEMRSHPLYAPIVREYREIALHLARRPRSNLRKRIEENMELQAQVQSMGEQMADALNAFEINRGGAPDPGFQQILQVQNAILEPEPRRDAITRALDSFESRQRR